MNLKQINRLEETLKAELDSDLEAIRRVKKLLKEREGKLPITRYKRVECASVKQSVTTGKPLNYNGNGTVESKVLSAISKTDGKFGLGDLKKKLSELYPNVEFNRNTLSGIVFRNKNKAFRVITEGQGRRNAVYEKM